MIIILKLIVLTFILVMGLKISTSEGMIFEKIGNYAKRKVEEGYKGWDLIACEWCAGTWLSIVAHFAAFGLGVFPFEWDWQLLIRWPFVFMGASFASGLSWTIYLTLNEIKESNKAQAAYFKYISDPKNYNDGKE